MMRRWSAVIAVFFVLATAAPAVAQVEQRRAPSQQGYLGVELRNLTREEAQALRLPTSGAAAVTKVEAGSPAGSAGLRRGDVLLEIDGKPAASAAQVLKLIAGKTPGAAVALRILRQGRLKAGLVKLGAKPDDMAAAGVPPVNAEEPAAAPAPASSEVPEPVQQTENAPALERFSDPEAQDKFPAEVVPQMGHSSDVHSVAFSPDGRFALSGSGDRTVKLWEVATGKELRSFSAHTGVVFSVAFSPGGRLALSGSGDHTLKLWDAATGKELRSFSGHTGWVNSVAFSPDDLFVLSCSKDRTLKLWEVATGKELRTFTGHTEQVNSIAFSPDGRSVLSGSRDKTLRLWDVATGKELRSFTGHTGQVASVAFSPDGTRLLSGSDDHTLKLWDAASGQLLRSFEGHNDPVWAVAFSPDGRFALSGSFDNTMKLWDVDTGTELRSFNGHASVVLSVSFSPDGRFALSGSDDSTLKLWDVATGGELRTFNGHASAVDSAAFSPDGHSVLSASRDNTLKLLEAATGKVLRSFTGHTDRVVSVAFSRDGRFALSGSRDKTLKLWELATGNELRSFTGHTGQVASVAFSPDGSFALSAGGGFPSVELKVWETATGKELRSFTRRTGEVNSVAFSPDGRFALYGSTTYAFDAAAGGLELWDVATGNDLRSFTGHNGQVTSVAFSPDGRFALSASRDTFGFSAGRDYTLKLWELASGKELWSFTEHSGQINSVAFSPDGRFALSDSLDNALKLWDAATGKELRSFSGHTGSISSVAFSPDGRLALSGSDDGTARIWDIAKGREVARMMAAPNGEWLTITPNGFFSASHRDTEMLALVRGMESTTIGQIHQSLFSPDLVREALAGDPDGEVKRAAEAVNLEKVLDSGPAPFVEITSHPSGSKADADLFAAAARITDRGKGIGRIEWRVNGITASVIYAPAGAGPDYDVKQELALDPGENQIEVIAYERRNLLASLPARATIAYDGPADSVKPKLHILAIGINAYEDRGWTPPGSSEKLAFPPLSLAVADATAFAAEMQKAGAGLYSEVRVTEALDTDATPAKLDRLVGQMAAGISPRDTFVLYAAAHGYSLNGRYYMIPQDYQGGTDPEALQSRAISQERLQDWIANHIKAKKAVILLDTCESGALVGGYTKSRTDAPASEAAIGRLHEATGRPVLTAAATGKPAFEGYKGHGVFTYALMEALHKGDSNNNGKIELTELVAHVERRVPELVAELGEHGGAVKGIAVTAMRGAKGDEQSAHFGSTGEDFAIVARLP